MEMLESVLFLNDLNKCLIIPVTSCMKIFLCHHIVIFFKALVGKGEYATMNTHKLTDMIGHSMYVWCYVGDIKLRTFCTNSLHRFRTLICHPRISFQDAC